MRILNFKDFLSEVAHRLNPVTPTDIRDSLRWSKPKPSNQFINPFVGPGLEKASGEAKLQGTP